jgi:hypothetical protein
MYKVLTYFTDLQDNDYPYTEGKPFPRDGLTVSEARLKELSSTNNRRGIKLIEFVEEEKKAQEQPKPLTKTEINRMNTSQLKELAVKNGIENAEEMTGAELKKVLISRFNL